MNKFTIFKNVENENSQLLLIIIPIVIVLFLIIIGITIAVAIIKVKKIKNNNNELKDKETKNINVNNSKRLNLIINDNLKKQEELNQLIEEYLLKLETIGSIDKESARKLYVDELYLQNKKSLIDKYNELEKEFISNYREKANNMIVSFLERNAESIIIERSTTFIKIEDESMKARLIGKEGRNKKTFEQLTGVDLIIEKDNQLITLSSANLARRELAKLVLNKLLETKNIEPSRIEQIYDLVKTEFENYIYNIGKNAIEEKLGVYDLNPEIYPFVGLLKYRTSYGQNILQHSLECANLAANIARTLELDETKAKLAAFFHDLGKCSDLDMNMDHVQAGIEISKKCQLPTYIINSIASHHNSVPVADIYGAITKIVDTLSSSRPGARIETYQEYIERVTKIEKICCQFDEVSTAYAIKSGRSVRVIIKPLSIKDEEISYLANKIKNEIEKDDLLKKYKLEITLIKENKFTTNTDIKF